MNRRTLALAGIRLGAGALFAARGAGTAAAQPSAHDTGARTRLRITTSAGDIIVLLEDKRTPKTVANFLHYVDSGFFSGGTFFRAIPDFVIQGGNKSREKPSDPKLELETPLVTGVLNKDGALSMARTPNPNSATSEFFICDGDQPRLDGSMSEPGYAAFGHVLAGMDVVRKIARMPADNQMLLEPVTIVRIARVH